MPGRPSGRQNTGIWAGSPPALWGGVHLALHLCGRIDWSRDGEAILYAAVILVLIWIVGRLQVRLRLREGEDARP